MTVAYRRLSALLILIIFSTSFPAHAGDPATQEAAKEAQERAKLDASLEAIMIREVRFNNSTLPEVLAFLARESKKADPHHRGITFVFQNLSTGSSARPITLELNNVPLHDVLRYSLYLSDPLLRPSLGDNHVITIRHIAEADSMLVKTLSVPDGFLSAESSGVTNATRQLIAKGVRFPAGSSAIYLSDKKTLVLKNTPDQIELIDELVASQTSDIQTKVGTRFIEINQGPQ